MNEIDPYKPPTAPIEQAPIDRREPIHGYQSIETLGKALSAMVLGYGVVQILEAVSYGMQAELLHRIQLHDAYTNAEASQNDIRVTAIAGFSVALFLATAVVFCMFVHRANRNARALGAQGMKYTPGQASGYFFVPVANLVVPYRVVSEIWQASAPAPTSWRAQKIPDYFTLWWGTWIGGNITARVAYSMSNAKGVDSLVSGSIVSIVSACLMVIASACAAHIVNEIRKRQTACGGR
jgi:Domain of unknown function (DUF4328)